MSSRPAMLCTADGESFRGRSVGSSQVSTGEVVFNTAMSGYQEIITDPSYAGQVVVMTAPHIGNYGVSENDEQSRRPWLAGLVVRSLSRRDSNWRSEGSLGEYLKEKGIAGIADVDTRRLTRHIRDRGAMPVAIGTDIDHSELLELAERAPGMAGRDLARTVSTPQKYLLPAMGKSVGRVVAIDLGIKTDILDRLRNRNFDVEVVPATTRSQEIMASDPAGIFVSNGPGDPEPLEETITTLRELIGQRPLFGICLGHQLLGLAAGASTYKLPFGHHGGNHPVRRMSDSKVEITSQNHGFAVDLWSLTDGEPAERAGLVQPDLLPESVETPFGPLVPTHQNLNDGTLEGMSLPDNQAFSIQYHPEAAPGPRDALGYFDDFVMMMESF